MHLFIPEAQKGNTQKTGGASNCKCNSGDCERQLLGKCLMFLFGFTKFALSNLLFPLTESSYCVACKTGSFNTRTQLCYWICVTDWLQHAKVSFKTTC